ncbi:MAG TPA: methyltransferase domain-containing protein [Candidatus Binatia bacterium]|nr:methyltransferase domain-containing protein [Candidatus Binatia bacterium]
MIAHRAATKGKAQHPDGDFECSGLKATVEASSHKILLDCPYLRRGLQLTERIFAHSTPALYDRYMGPLLFEPYAKLLAERCAVLHPHRILETAAGTGIVTRAVHRAAPRTQIVATDVNPAMLEYAANELKIQTVSFRPANAQALPFDAGSFDVVLCQFGAMFFPDKILAHREARRVLSPNGHYLLVTFNRLELNPVPKAAADAVNALFAEPFDYMDRGPFSYADSGQIKSDLFESGFTEVKIETIELSTRVNARDAARGLVFGSPLRAEIERRDPSAVNRAADAVAHALAPWHGKDAPMSAHLVTATNSATP